MCIYISVCMCVYVYMYVCVSLTVVPLTFCSFIFQCKLCLSHVRQPFYGISLGELHILGDFCFNPNIFFSIVFNLFTPTDIYVHSVKCFISSQDCTSMSFLVGKSCVSLVAKECVK